MRDIPQDFIAFIVQPDVVGVFEPASIGILFIHPIDQALIDPDIDPILAIAANAGANRPAGASIRWASTFARSELLMRLIHAILVPLRMAQFEARSH